MSAHASRSSYAARTAATVLEAARQRRFPYASAQVIRAAQESRVRATVSYAQAHVPYYRETMRRLNLSPDDFRTASDLARLPLIERDQLQRDPEYFVSERWPPSSCVKLESGGSTGEPITLFRDPPALLKAAAYYERVRHVVRGLVGRPRYREAAIVPSDSSTATSDRELRARWRMPKVLTVRRRVFSMSTSPAELIDELSEYRPDVVVSYGSYLDALFGEIRDHGSSSATPHVAVYGADPMSAATRDWVSDVLGVHVLSTYAAVEAPLIGFECERHEGHHLNIDLYPIRVIGSDGREVAHGERGEVIVSNLVNAGTVLLNYRLGDLLAFSSERCRCGRTLLLGSYLERVENAWLDLGDGQVVHAQILKAVLRHDRQLVSYQIVQEAPRRFLLRAVPNPGCDPEATASRLRARLEEQLPDGAVVRVEFLSQLPRSRSGKLQPVVPLARG